MENKFKKGEVVFAKVAPKLLTLRVVAKPFGNDGRALVVDVAVSRNG